MVKKNLEELEKKTTAKRLKTQSDKGTTTEPNADPHKEPLINKGKEEKEKKSDTTKESKETAVVVRTHADLDKEDDEADEEEEEEFYDLTDTQLKIKACTLLLVGTLICTFVSDPMVDVISCVGTKLNVSPFYISFVVTPLASNASEVIAGLVFARKKTVESISLTLATLHGAATMNSTLALCIFMSLVYFRNLSWSFSAEVITVLVVIFAVGLNGLRKTVYLWQAILVGSLYPLSILLVYLLENVGGMD